MYRNIHNCIVESMAPTEGMNRLIRYVAGLGEGLVVGGEGLNEITAQGQSFGQVHLFKSWQSSIEGCSEPEDATSMIFSWKLCRTSDIRVLEAGIKMKNCACRSTRNMEQSDDHYQVCGGYHQS